MIVLCYPLFVICDGVRWIGENYIPEIVGGAENFARMRQRSGESPKYGYGGLEEAGICSLLPFSDKVFRKISELQQLQKSAAIGYNRIWVTIQNHAD